MNKIFQADPPLDEYPPGSGTWALAQAGQGLSLNYINPYCGGNNNGSWAIKNYCERNAYGESITFEREFSLSNGRKVIRWFRIYKD